MLWLVDRHDPIAHLHIFLVNILFPWISSVRRRVPRQIQNGLVEEDLFGWKGERQGGEYTGASVREYMVRYYKY